MQLAKEVYKKFLNKDGQALILKTLTLKILLVRVKYTYCGLKQTVHNLYTNGVPLTATMKQPSLENRIRVMIVATEIIQCFHSISIFFDSGVFLFSNQRSFGNVARNKPSHKITNTQMVRHPSLMF